MPADITTLEAVRRFRRSLENGVPAEAIDRGDKEFAAFLDAQFAVQQDPSPSDFSSQETDQ